MTDRTAMRPFFADDSRKQALWRAANAWVGTRFFHGAEERGVGVDCVRLAHALYVATGAMRPIEHFPTYSLDYARHCRRSQLLRFLLDCDRFRGWLRLVPPQPERLRPGDLLGCACGRADHHLAVVLPWGKVVHAVDGAGVVIQDLAENVLTKRILYAMRLMEDQQRKEP